MKREGFIHGRVLVSHFYQRGILYFNFGFGFGSETTLFSKSELNAIYFGGYIAGLNMIKSYF